MSSFTAQRPSAATAVAHSRALARRKISSQKFDITGAVLGREGLGALELATRIPSWFLARNIGFLLAGYCQQKSRSAEV